MFRLRGVTFQLPVDDLGGVGLEDRLSPLSSRSSGVLLTLQCGSIILQGW